MKFHSLLLWAAATLTSDAVRVTDADPFIKADPISKVISFVEGLKTTVEKDGDENDKAYFKYTRWCANTYQDKLLEKKLSIRAKDKLTAKIQESASIVDESNVKIAQLGNQIAEDKADLKAATEIRTVENTAFIADDKDLMQSQRDLSQAIMVLEKLGGSKVSFAQVSANPHVASALASIATRHAGGAKVSPDDQMLLMGLLEASQRGSATEAEDEVGAPAAAIYKSHSGDVLALLRKLQIEADTQLDAARKAEAESQHHYNLLKVNINDEIGQENKDLSEQKVNKVKAASDKAAAQRELKVVEKNLKDNAKAMADLQKNCMSTAAQQQNDLKERAQEMNAIVKALKVLKDKLEPQRATAGYTFLQVQESSTSTQERSAILMKTVLDRVQRLAREHKSKVLMQLASRVAAIAAYGSSFQGDPFAKVKKLIKDMMAKLEKEGSSEASEKQFCDKEMKKSKEKKKTLKDATTALKVETDKMVASIATAKQEIVDFDKELASIKKQQAMMDDARTTANKAFIDTKKDLETGLQGAREAIKIFRDVYSSTSALQTDAQADSDDPSFLQTDEEAQAEDASPNDEDALLQQPKVPKYERSKIPGGSVVGLLQVIEADMAKQLAVKSNLEQVQKDKYEKTTRMNKESAVLKAQARKFKVQDVKEFERRLAELTSDHGASADELKTISQYLQKIIDRCVAQPGTLADRIARRAAEIEGLKEALSILAGELVFTQMPANAGFLAP